MSSTTRLLVLGVVRNFQPVHGYEVRRELVSWRAAEWAAVKPGSIYNALKSMTADGLLEVVGTDQVGGRPERTSYRLTAVGDEALRGLLREAWWTVSPVVDPLMGAIAFLGMVARDEAIAALEQRIVHIRGYLRQTDFVIAAHDGTDSPEHVRELMRLTAARMASEIAWAEAFIARLRAGEYATASDPRWDRDVRAAEKPADDAPREPEKLRKPRAAKPTQPQPARSRKAAAPPPRTTRKRT